MRKFTADIKDRPMVETPNFAKSDKEKAKTLNAKRAHKKTLLAAYSKNYKGQLNTPEKTISSTIKLQF